MYILRDRAVVYGVALSFNIESGKHIGMKKGYWDEHDKENACTKQ